MPMSPRLLRPRAAPSTGFDPRSISGLALWLDGADTASMGNTSTGAGGASNNGPVKYWTDKSGNGRHATNAGADSVCPTLLAGTVNGLSALGFDGGDSIAGSQGWTVTAQTTFAVARMSASAAAYARLFTQSDAGNDFDTSGNYIPLLRAVSQAAISSWAATGTRASVSVPLDTWLVACSRHNGSQIANSVNGGADVVATGQSLNKAFTRYRIGEVLANVSTAGWANAVAEVLVFTRSLSGTEKQVIDRYLGAKWGVAVA